ncbi:MAG: VOC family protein [Anaerolineales bacterium]|jgi:catechol 2,3-dioxygenase-like lactoylglutathione lyase family enzyme
MITGLFHASYTISDVEKTVSFCKEVLGLEHTRWQISNQPYLASVTGIPGCSLRIGFARAEGDDTSYEMVEYVQPKGPRARTGFGIPGSIYMSWEVDNLEAAIERLRKANTSIIASPATIEDGLWKDARGVFFLGPDDILTELVEIKHQPDGNGRLLRLHHVTFSITSIEKALGIFCEKLKLTLDLIVNSSGDYVSNFIRLPDPSMRKAYLSIPNTNCKMELLEYRTAAGPTADMATNNLASGHACFRADDMNSTYRELRSVGVEFVGKPTEITAGVNKGGYATYFKGTDGIRFELFQNPPAV